MSDVEETGRALADGRRWCPQCAKYQEREAFGGKGTRQIETYCRECNRVRRRHRGDHSVTFPWVDAPGTEKFGNGARRPFDRGLASQPGTGLGPLRPIKRPYPVTSPTKCCHEALPCWKDDGEALAFEMHSGGNTCVPFVRGWATTIPEHAEGLVTPRFESKIIAALWNDMIKYRTRAR